jgi:hypothetical protein
LVERAGRSPGCVGSCHPALGIRQTGCARSGHVCTAAVEKTVYACVALCCATAASGTEHVALLSVCVGWSLVPRVAFAAETIGLDSGWVALSAGVAVQLLL